MSTESEVFMKNNELSIKDKYILTSAEASVYSNIGVRRIEDMLREPKCTFVLRNGNKKLVKRKEFEQFLDENCSV